MLRRVFLNARPLPAVLLPRRAARVRLPRVAVRFLSSEPVRLRLPEDEATAGTQRAITRWFKKEGDEVKSGEALCEVDSGEVVYDYVSPVNGFVVKITALAGSTDLKGGEVIAFLASSSDAITSVKYVAQKEVAEKRVVMHGLPRDEPVKDEGPVSEWLKRLSPDLVQYASALKEDGFDSLESLATLTEDDLTTLAVTKKGHRNLLLKGVSELKSTNGGG